MKPYLPSTVVRTDSPSSNHILGRTARLQRFGGRRRAALFHAAADANGSRRGSGGGCYRASRRPELHQLPPTTVASFNGFTNSQNNVTVTVSEPSLASPYPSGVTYVEVDISQTVPT